MQKGIMAGGLLVVLGFALPAFLPGVVNATAGAFILALGIVTAVTSYFK